MEDTIKIQAKGNKINVSQ